MMQMLLVLGVSKTVCCMHVYLFAEYSKSLHTPSCVEHDLQSFHISTHCISYFSGSAVYSINQFVVSHSHFNTVLTSLPLAFSPTSVNYGSSRTSKPQDKAKE